MGQVSAGVLEEQIALCDGQVRNVDCWDRGYEFSDCCIPQPPRNCWSGSLTPRRCCQRNLGPITCDDSDLSFLNDYFAFQTTGFMSPLWLVPSSDPGEYRTWLYSDALDDEVERCPHATLARMLLDIELLTTLALEDTNLIVREALEHFQILMGASKARNALSVSPYRFPETLLYTGSQRIDQAISLYRDEQTLKYFVTFAGASTRQDHRASKFFPCILDPFHFNDCLRQFPSPNLFSIIVTLLLAAPHATAVTRMYPDLGLIAVLTASVVSAAQFLGINDVASSDILSQAHRTLVLKLRRPFAHSRGELLRLKAVASIVNHATQNGTKGSYAEYGKDDLILEIVRRAGSKTNFFVEIGVGDGKECNTRFLRQHMGWRGIMLDQLMANEAIGLHRRFVTVANINRIFLELGVPRDFDLLSIDVDGNDFWLWWALNTHFRPRVVIIEYQSGFRGLDVVTKYAPSNLGLAVYHPRILGLLGSSAKALSALAHAKGYRYAARRENTDLFFVRADLDSTLEAPLGEMSPLPNMKDWVTKVADDLYVTSSAALEVSVPPAINYSWYGRCLEEALENMCEEFSLCWKS